MFGGDRNQNSRPSTILSIQLKQRSTNVDSGGLYPCGRLATCVVVPDDAVDDLGHGDVLSLGFGLDFLNERLLNVQGPALRRSR